MNMQTIPPDTSILNVNSQNNKILRAFGEMSKETCRKLKKKTIRDIYRISMGACW